MACEKLLLSDIKNIFGLLKEVMVSNKDRLIEIDGIMGDGDLGLTMAAAFGAAADEFPEETDLGKVFIKAGMVMAKAAPSTMGTLMGTGFMRGGKAVKEKTELGIEEMAQFWRAFVEGMEERGKAKPGDKTIIDSLDPAASVLEKAAAEGKSLKAGFAEALSAAEAGMENTRTMEAQFGRLAYNQEKAKTLIDPGSEVGVLLIKTFADYFV
ncbi:MAG: dihydroxyacetone kinase subunit L [Treponema sp.]|nr:dihydroxyacetone kinase subunit L [Treponema sp.]